MLGSILRDNRLELNLNYGGGLCFVPIDTLIVNIFYCLVINTGLVEKTLLTAALFLLLSYFTSLQMDCSYPKI